MLRVAVATVLLLAAVAVSTPAAAVSPGSVDAALMTLVTDTAALQGTIPKARFEGLIKQLLKAIENTALGAGDCAAGSEVKADNRYRSTRGWLLKYIQTLDSVGLVPSTLEASATSIIAMVDELIAVVCAGNDPAANTNGAVYGVGGKPR